MQTCACSHVGMHVHSHRCVYELAHMRRQPHMQERADSPTHGAPTCAGTRTHTQKTYEHHANPNHFEPLLIHTPQCPCKHKTRARVCTRVDIHTISLHAHSHPVERKPAGLARAPCTCTCTRTHMNGHTHGRTGTRICAGTSCALMRHA